MDLAHDMIRMSGYTPGADIAVQITGTRPGEKLHEELMLDAEDLAETSHSKIMVGRVPPVTVEAAQVAVERLRLAADSGDGTVRAVLQEIIPEARISPACDDGDAASGYRPVAGLRIAK